MTDKAHVLIESVETYNMTGMTEEDYESLVQQLKDSDSPEVLRIMAPFPLFARVAPEGEGGQRLNLFVPKSVDEEIVATLAADMQLFQEEYPHLSVHIEASEALDKFMN